MTHDGWTAFTEEMPPEHRLLLVTNNLEARNAYGEMSHVWLAGMVYQHSRRMEWNGMVEAEAGEITAFDDRDCRIRDLTHWRLALPPGDKERALAVLVPALLECVRASGDFDGAVLEDLLVEAGLIRREPFDPERPEHAVARESSLVVRMVNIGKTVRSFPLDSGDPIWLLTDLGKHFDAHHAASAASK